MRARHRAPHAHAARDITVLHSLAVRTVELVRVQRVHADFAPQASLALVLMLSHQLALAVLATHHPRLALPFVLQRLALACPVLFHPNALVVPRK